MDNNLSKDKRTRNWTFIVYPDSAPDNWRDILNDLHIEWVESPLHDKDVNGNGETKKAHWHILLIFKGNKSYSQILEICKMVNAPVPDECRNVKSLIRYFAHLDNPEKAQYSISDIKSYGGIDINDYLRPTSSERYIIIREIIEFVKSENIIEFTDLMEYAMYNEFDTWFPLLCDNSAYVVNLVIKSQRHRGKN